MIVLPELGGKGPDLWPALIDIAEAIPDGWVLVGGQMVLLHALENGATWPRVSLKLDVIVKDPFELRADLTVPGLLVTTG